MNLEQNTSETIGSTLLQTWSKASESYSPLFPFFEKDGSLQLDFQVLTAQQRKVRMWLAYFR